MRAIRRLLLTTSCLLVGLLPLAVYAEPIPIKVVVLTTFESGASAGTGTRAGEFGLWAERLPLRRSLKVPGIEGRVLLSDDGVLGVVTGMRARPRESVTALILDPELDVSHAYWLVAGIAGIDPRAGSIGSAAWARYVVDADPTLHFARGGAGAAFEAAYRVGSPVVKALVAGWDQYATTPPRAKN
jgi:purine nucleoside permease